MSLTAFVLIALQEAKDICEAQVNVSVPCPPLLPLLLRHSLLGGSVITASALFLGFESGLFGL